MSSFQVRVSHVRFQSHPDRREVMIHHADVLVGNAFFIIHMQCRRARHILLAEYAETRLLRTQWFGRALASRVQRPGPLVSRIFFPPHCVDSATFSLVAITQTIKQCFHAATNLTTSTPTHNWTEIYLSMGPSIGMHRTASYHL